MVDSTNPRVMADNIKTLAAAGGGTTVVANPEGEATDTLEKLGVGEGIYSIPQAPEVVPIEYCEENLAFSSGEAWLKDKDGNQLVAGDVVLTAFGLTETSNKHVYNVFIDSGKLKARAINGLNDTGYTYNGTTNLAVVYIKHQS